MEYRLEVIKKFISIFLALSMLSACGYFDNDGARNSKKIVGNIYIEEFEGVNNIVLKETDQASAGVISDCRLIYYDSIVKVIYVESPFTDETSSYYRIRLIDSSSRKVWEALKKESIDKSSFERGIKRKGSVKIEF
ncbi:MAG: hypothetical protein ACKO96_13685 [Flammeovirgaceae bacterium]